MNNIRKIITASVFSLALLLCVREASAQRYSVSTNLVEWFNLGTVNLDGGVAVAQHFSVHAGFRYNNWSFRPGDPEDRFEDPFGAKEEQFENRKQAYCLSLRYWPWYVYSGLWLYGRAQYMEYNRGGLIHHSAEEGDAVGAGLGAGYTHMIHKNWNIEFGLGFWGGMKRYTEYRCTNCGSVIGHGAKPFVLPDDVFLSVIYVF